MEAKIGLSPEEMITVFNRMYLDAWERTKERINWESAHISEQLAQGKQVDISNWIVEVLEVVVTAARDGAVLTMIENNERIKSDLSRAGLIIPETPDEDSEDASV